jgi:hypothetical protein
MYKTHCANTEREWLRNRENVFKHLSNTPKDHDESDPSMRFQCFKREIARQFESEVDTAGKTLGLKFVLRETNATYDTKKMVRAMEYLVGKFKLSQRSGNNGHTSLLLILRSF